MIFVVAAILVLLMLHGQRWVLQQAPAMPDELTVATCAIEVVKDVSDPANACTGNRFE